MINRLIQLLMYAVTAALQIYYVNEKVAFITMFWAGIMLGHAGLWITELLFDDY